MALQFEELAEEMVGAIPEIEQTVRVIRASSVLASGEKEPFRHALYVADPGFFEMFAAGAAWL